MADHTLKQITDTSWILQKNGVRIALLTIKEEKITVFGKIGKSLFDNMNELKNYLGGTFEIEQSEEAITEELGDIRGYPSKHQGIIPIEDADLPAYKKSTSSNIVYAAGYYAILFKNGWTPWYCPKMSTLKETEYMGPFKTKIEMNNSISQKKKEKTYE